MRIRHLIAVLAQLTAFAAALNGPPVLQRDSTSSYQPRCRISPLDGSIIALPTQEQLDFQDKEIGMLVSKIRNHTVLPILTSCIKCRSTSTLQHT
jgi:hypothetical protein